MTVSEVRRHSAVRPLIPSWGIHETLPARRSSSGASSAALLLLASLSERRSPHQRLARVGPAVGMSITRVVVFHIGAQPLLELRRRSEVATFQETPRQDAEPQFHLVEPRTVLGREVKHVLVRRVG